MTSERGNKHKPPNSKEELTFKNPFNYKVFTMKIWKQICLESGVQRIDGRHTIVLYLSEKRINLNAKTRAGVVKSLLRLGVQVFGACAPVNKLVVQTIKDLEGETLSQSTLNKLKRKNQKYTPFKFSRDYQMIINWLSFELEGRRIDKSTFRRELKIRRVNSRS